MKLHGFRLAVILSLAALSACAPAISPELRKEARKDLSFDLVAQNPAAHTGSVVIWGGIIISVDNGTEGSSIAVLETPLGYREEPEGSEYSRGRFIATTPQLADPLVFAKGRKITVAGEITGKETKPIEKSEVMYSYPVIRIKQIVLWSTEYSPYGAPEGFQREAGFGSE